MEKRWVYLCALMLPSSVLAADHFGFDQVRDQARILAQKPAELRRDAIPEPLKSLTYLQYQAIHFKSQAALWSADHLPFQVEFFLPGSIHHQTVRISEVSSEGIRPVAFRPESFDFGTNRFDLPADFGYAGFRIIQTTSRRWELAAFLDATYFRMINQGGAFGASARGLALNTVLREKEEFPFFREFWLRKPGPQDASITIWALMDSPSVTGAFEFAIHPGVETVTRTQAAFFPRTEVKEFGIAPLTSMFLFDQNSHPPNADFRPSVHDSDGLLLHTGRDQWLWRPLESGRMMRVNAYQDSNPKGFGLMQRDRNFEDYQDLVARFETRPSVWVEPIGSWGDGHVELVQLPSAIEYADNTVAFWVPATPPRPGKSLGLAYSVHWLTNEVTPKSLGRVKSTRMGQIATGTNRPPNLRFVIDFEGPTLQALTPSDQIEPEIACGEGARLLNKSVEKNERNGTWRLALELTTPSKAVDLRAVLNRQNRPMTEAWTFTWQP